MSEQIARYLDLAAAEAKLTAANMANVDTPGYRTVGMDFEAEMREAMSDVEQGRAPRQRAHHRCGWADRAARRKQCFDRSRKPEPGRGAAEVQNRRGPAAAGVPARDGRHSCGQQEVNVGIDVGNRGLEHGEKCSRAHERDSRTVDRDDGSARTTARWGACDDELFGLMETSGGAMEAERMRAEVVAANMANAETTRTATGGPYRRQEVVFAADRGDPGFLDSMNAASAGALRRPGALPALRHAAVRLPGIGTGRSRRACTLRSGRRSFASAQALRSRASRRRAGRICRISGH